MARDRKRAKQRRRRRGGEQQSQADAFGRSEAPDPLEHASADADLAEASMVDPPSAELGRDELVVAAEESEQDVDVDDGSAPHAGRKVAGPGQELPPEGNRVVNFLRACAAELRRVQWPDRRQVTQATGVVLGFVVLAGAYLGVLDAIFSRLVGAIL